MRNKTFKWTGHAINNNNFIYFVLIYSHISVVPMVLVRIVVWSAIDSAGPNLDYRHDCNLIVVPIRRC